MKKQLAILLAILLIMMGVCGCMNEKQGYKEAIQTFLQEKYDCDFEITKVQEVFSGDRGTYLQATCETKAEGDHFMVYCYPTDSTVGEQIVVGDTTYEIQDAYSEVVLRKELRRQLEEQVGQDVFLECQVVFSNYFLTGPEFQAGLKSCLEDPGLASHVTVYLVADTMEKLEAAREATEKLCLEYNAYRQYLYFALSTAEQQQLQTHYQEHADTFDRHMNQCEAIDQVYFSLIKRDEGITKRSVEKE